MTRQCIISPTASRYLEAIVDYFLARNVEAGDNFAIKFEQKCRNIANFPMMVKSYPDLAVQLRGIPLDGYIIFYKLTDDITEIVRVVRGDRDLGSIFPKPETS